MKHLFIFLIFIFVGCSCKDSLVIKYVDKNVTIPSDFFYCADLQSFILEENTTKKDWQRHIIKMDFAYKDCKKVLERLRQRYGK